MIIHHPHPGIQYDTIHSNTNDNGMLMSFKVEILSANAN